MASEGLTDVQRASHSHGWLLNRFLRALASCRPTGCSDSRLKLALRSVRLALWDGETGKPALLVWPIPCKYHYRILGWKGKLGRQLTNCH